jgi:hypothetical protein
MKRKERNEKIYIENEREKEKKGRYEVDESNER